MDEPILVHGSPIPDMAFSFMRDAAKILVAFALGRGWIQGDTATVIAGLGAAFAVAWGQYKTFKRSSQLTAIARDPNTPESVVQIKGTGNA